LTGVSSWHPKTSNRRLPIKSPGHGLGICVRRTLPSPSNLFVTRPLSSSRGEGGGEVASCVPSSSRGGASQQSLLPQSPVSTEHPELPEHSARQTNAVVAAIPARTVASSSRRSATRERRRRAKRSPLAPPSVLCRKQPTRGDDCGPFRRHGRDHSAVTLCTASRKVEDCCKALWRGLQAGQALKR